MFRQISSAAFPTSAMKVEMLFFLLTLCVLGSGCSLSENAWRTTIAEPIHYPSYWYDKWARVRFRRLAQRALEQEKALARAELDDNCNEPFSVDHQLGFVDGFVDFLDAGGTGYPPPLPPRRYWKADFQTPDGYRAAQDWFRGYEHGALSAHASGYRRLITVPVSDAIVSTTIPYPYPYSESRKVKQRDQVHAGLADHADTRDRFGFLPEVTRLPSVTERR